MELKITITESDQLAKAQKTHITMQVHLIQV